MAITGFRGRRRKRILLLWALGSIVLAGWQQVAPAGDAPETRAVFFVS